MMYAQLEGMFSDTWDAQPALSCPHCINDTVC